MVCAPVIWMGIQFRADTIRADTIQRADAVRPYHGDVNPYRSFWTRAELIRVIKPMENKTN